MMGVGGAMMLWRLAWAQTFPLDRDVIEARRTGIPYTPAILPGDRAKAFAFKWPASMAYYKLVDFLTIMQYGCNCPVCQALNEAGIDLK